MTDKQKLDERVKECGYRMEYVAERLGITVQALYNKRCGTRNFTAPEINTLCEMLSIDTMEEMRDIFFAKC